LKIVYTLKNIAISIMCEYNKRKKVRNSHLIGGIVMIAELRPKSQVTIPKQLINSLGLSTGDKLEIFENKGMICIMPVVVYPKGYVDKILEDMEMIRQNVANGNQPVFNDIDDLIASLEGDDQ